MPNFGPPEKYQCFKKSTPNLSLAVSTVLWCHRVAKPGDSASFQVEIQKSKNSISASKSVKIIWLMMVESTKWTLPVYRFRHFSTINALIPWLMGQIVHFVTISASIYIFNFNVKELFLQLYFFYQCIISTHKYWLFRAHIIILEDLKSKKNDKNHSSSRSLRWVPPMLVTNKSSQNRWTSDQTWKKQGELKVVIKKEKNLNREL